MSDHHNFGGAWTLVKLAALKSYLPAFTTALSRQSFQLLYIDAFAGTGRCDIKIDGAATSVDGSARIALEAQPAFDKLYFIEMDEKKHRALESLATEHQGRSVKLIKDDANIALRSICMTNNWKNTRAVLFLDPYGMNVEWDTLRAIANTQAIDIWYLFPYSALYRQAAKNADRLAPEKEAAITRLLGTEAWKEKFYAPPRQPSLFGNDSDVRTASHSEMLDFVSNRLKNLFPATTTPKILRQSTGAPLFALYFAVSNPNQRACGIATKIADHIIKNL
ncbi:three-Cys-motif partner protein TcmP [Magnetospirillum gryphiswaldense]|uniref:three-Cys-motif partner protein TcmP n=1 Tax=Magnetospirillum gryphiswaldense TaxID=55518 RepID=UPI00130D9916|nr:three-Cys-motif partner protein TcmP [Magnetospirillum gryphiswaldense]